MKLLLCFGTRPEAIKMAPLYHQLSKTKDVSVKLCITAQYREMLDQVLSFFEIVLDIDLNIMLPNQTLNALSSNILSKMDEVLKTENPDLVLVHGDTTIMQKSSLIISDSGGIQEEAPTFKKQILVTREVSQRLEGVASGFSILVGTNKELIVEKANHYLNINTGTEGKNPYGDGKASQKIIKFLLKNK